MPVKELVGKIKTSWIEVLQKNSTIKDGVICCTSFEYDAVNGLLHSNIDSSFRKDCLLHK